MFWLYPLEEKYWGKKKRIGKFAFGFMLVFCLRIFWRWCEIWIKSRFAKKKGGGEAFCKPFYKSRMYENDVKQEADCSRLNTLDKVESTSRRIADVMEYGQPIFFKEVHICSKPPMGVTNSQEITAWESPEIGIVDKTKLVKRPRVGHIAWKNELRNMRNALYRNPTLFQLQGLRSTEHI